MPKLHPRIGTLIGPKGNQLMYTAVKRRSLSWTALCYFYWCATTANITNAAVYEKLTGVRTLFHIFWFCHFRPVSASSSAEFRPLGTGGNVCNPCRSCSRLPSNTCQKPLDIFHPLRKASHCCHGAMHRACTLQLHVQLNRPRAARLSFSTFQYPTTCSQLITRSKAVAKVLLNLLRTNIEQPRLNVTVATTFFCRSDGPDSARFPVAVPPKFCLRHLNG